MCVSYCCSIISLDNKVPADVLEALRGMDDVREVHAASVTPYFNVEKDVSTPSVVSGAQ